LLKESVIMLALIARGCFTTLLSDGGVQAPLDIRQRVSRNSGQHRQTPPLDAIAAVPHHRRS